MIDLHCHTTASDGSLAPLELVEKAAALSMTHLSITDHDTTAGLTEARQACHDASIVLIPGIELSTRYDGRPMDILGYGIDSESSELQRGLARLVKARYERIPRMIARLQEAGLDIAVDDVIDHVGGDVIGRPHVAQALVRKGIVADVNEAFKRYIGRGQAGYVPKEVLSYEDAIRLIRAAKGIAVLAHPGFLKLESRRFEMLLDQLMDAGLAGIEVYYSLHTPDEVTNYAETAKKRGLLATGGSDFHGRSKPDIELGMGPEGKPLPTSLAIDLLRAIES